MYNRSGHEYKVECEYDFRISNQSRSLGPNFSLLLISREEGSEGEIGVLRDNLTLVLIKLKLVLSYPQQQTGGKI